MTAAMTGEQGATFTITCSKGSVDCTSWTMLKKRYALSEISVYAGTQRTFSGDLRHGMSHLRHPAMTSVTVHELQYRQLAEEDATALLKLVTHPHFQYNSPDFDRTSVWRLWSHARERLPPRPRQIALQALKDIARRDTTFAPGTDYPIRLPETCRGVDTRALKRELALLISTHPRITETATGHIQSHITFPRTTETSVGDTLVNIRRTCREWAPDKPGL